MSKLGNLTYRDVAHKLRRLGFHLDRQAKGSHEIWVNLGTERHTTLSHHRGNMNERTVRSILEQAGIDVDDFLKA
jgi:predicted RNA binding protein YcfA (HicA-like mRNA interferase family)